MYQYKYIVSGNGKDSGKEKGKEVVKIVTIHSRCERIIFHYPSLAYAFADRFKILHRFLLKYLESIRKRKIGHAWQHADFPRELIALRFRCLIYAPLRIQNYVLHRGRARFLCKQVYIRTSLCLREKRTPCNRIHVLSVEALANRRHFRGVFYLVMWRSVMSGSESVPHRKALNRCMLLERFCEAHIHRNHAKQSSHWKVCASVRHNRFFFFRMWRKFS